VVVCVVAELEKAFSYCLQTGCLRDASVLQQLLEDFFGILLAHFHQFFVLIRTDGVVHFVSELDGFVRTQSVQVHQSFDDSFI